MALVRRQRAAAGGPAGKVVDEGKHLFHALPALYEWLTETAWGPSEPRVTGTVMFFVEDGRWKAWLHDRDALEGCFVSGDSLAELCKAVEKVIASGSGDWRPDRKGGRK